MICEELRDLILPVKREYFEAIKSGEKVRENRLYNDYWKKRLHPDKLYRNVVITLGYPKKDDESRRLVFPFTGYEVRTITHKHFGSEPVTVFSIFLDKEPKF